MRESKEPKAPPKTKPKKRDPLKRIKYIGYCMARLPDGVITLEDYVRYAKFFLASKTHKLMKDPIWDSYTTEELLAEFFAHQFEVNKRFLETFEDDMMDELGKSDDFSDWADKQMAKDRREKEKLLGEMDQRISFDPTKDLIGADE